ncbi:MAG TPA: hypothetical protein VGL89_05055 [Candidatus Koribacter sp.]|jgi:hypothetical protein
MADYASKLQVAKFLRGALITLMAALVPCVLIAAFFARAYLVYVIAIFVAGLLIVRLGFQLWPCPRCGKPYFRSSTWAGPNMFTKRCMHCQLAEAGEELPSITGTNKSE